MNLKYTNTNFPLRYKIQQKTVFTFNGMAISDTSAEAIWRIDNWKKNNEGYIVSLTSEKHETNSNASQMADLITLMGKFNIPMTDLMIQLNEKGKPIEVLNQTEIYNKWVGLRDGELSKFKEEEQTNNILIAGDKDYSNTLPIILNSSYYMLFFPPVYGQKKSSNSKFNKINLGSTLFQGSNVEINIGENVIGMTDSGISMNHIGLGCIDDYNKAEKAFNDGYKKIVEEPFDYEYRYNADYLYNTNGVLIKSNAEIQEKACEKVNLKQTYQAIVL